MAQEAKAAGYRAVLFKSNDFSCHDRAYLLRQAVPGIELFGSIVLNRATGATLNTYAVEKALATTGNLCRTVWMPTLDAEYAAELQVGCDRAAEPSSKTHRSFASPTATASCSRRRCTSWNYARKPMSPLPPATVPRQSRF